MEITNIYGLFDPRSPDIIMYVGKGLEKRAQSHWKKFLTRGIAQNFLLRQWFKKLLIEGIMPGWKFLEERIENWEQRERVWISYWHWMNPELCNLHPGGNEPPPPAIEILKKFGRIVGLSNLGRKLSTEHRKNISKGLQGRACLVETRQKISKANTGKMRSLESRKIMSELKLGKKHSEEHCRKMSESMRGKNIGKIRSDETRRKLSESHRGLIPLPTRGGHNRWHEKRGIINPECQYCRPDFFDIWESANRD